MQSSSKQHQNLGYQGYQGYPYVNPIVTDVPSIDAATAAARWANLPRRPYGQGGQVNVVNSPGYVHVVNESEPSGSGYNGQEPSQPQSSSPRDPVPPKRDIDVNPVVYIDLPEAGSEVSQSIVTPGSEQPEFVQDTILYDPFENRRIDVLKEDTASEQSSPSGSNSPAVYRPSTSRPNPPNTLNLGSPGPSGMQSTPSRSTPNIPDFMTKESLVYGGHGSDGFPISPIPLSDFPEPPPAYTEAPPPQPQRVQSPEVPPSPPRTTVIIAGNPSSPVTGMPIGVLNYERKNLTCHHCGVRVHTLVVKEIGYMTHFIACLVIIICIPLVFLVYFSDYFKHKNHYCPNCNKLIGYELPIGGQKIEYVT